MTIIEENPELAYGARVEVPPPPYTPFAHGFFAGVDVRSFDDPHERNGVWSRVQPYTNPETAAGPDAYTYADGCDPSDDRTKTIPRGSLYTAGDPFAVYGGYRCTPVGTTAEERDDLARQALQLGEERAVEKLMVDQVTSNGVNWPTPFETQTVDATDGHTLANSWGGLELVLAGEYGGVGLVQVPTSLVEYLASHALIKPADGGGFTTALGNKVVVNRSLPSNLDSSVDTLVGGAVAVRRGPIETLGDFRASFDRTDNTVIRIVERVYVIETNYPLPQQS